MLKNYLLAFGLFFSVSTLAQKADSNTQIPKEANRKDHPIEFRSGEFALNTAFKTRLDPKDKGYSKPNFNKVRYTPEQLERITYLLTNDVLPEGLKGDRLDANRPNLPYYTGYWVGNLKMDGEFWCLIYIPKDENAHMPEDMIPQSEEGAFFTTNIMAPRFRNITLAGTKPPIDEPSMQQESNGISTTTATLSRWSRSRGVIALWYGDGTTVMNYRAFSVDRDATIDEQTVVNELKQDASSGYDYIGYTFMEGFSCRDIYRDIARKLNVSLQEAQDLRLGTCADQVLKFDK